MSKNKGSELGDFLKGLVVGDLMMGKKYPKEAAEEIWKLMVEKEELIIEIDKLKKKLR